MNNRPSTAPFNPAMAKAIGEAGFTASPAINTRTGSDALRAIRFLLQEVEDRLHHPNGELSASKELLMNALLRIIEHLNQLRSNAQLKDAIDGFVADADALDSAVDTLFEGSKEQIKELTEELQALQASAGTPAMTGAISLSAISAELERRAQAATEIGILQANCDDELDTLRTRDALLEQRGRAGQATAADREERRTLKLKIESATQTIRGISEAFQQNEERQQMLRNYAAALALIEKGLPPGIFGEPLFDRAVRPTK